MRLPLGVTAEIRNPECGGAHCTKDKGEVRLLPTGEGSNAILCHACYRHEISYRRERNRSLGEFAKFSLPPWESLEVYKGAE
jgi:hypothetical protein